MSKVTGLCKISNLRKSWLYLQKNGLKDTWYAAAERVRDKNSRCYELKTLPLAEIEAQQKQAEKLKQESSVCFSILVPAYETKPQYLLALLQSVAAQTYSDWELVIVDASQTACVADTVEQFCRKQPYCNDKIVYHKLQENQGISDNSNAGLSLLSGNYTGLMDHDDTLAPDALYEMAQAIDKAQKAGEEAIMLYSDEDKMDESGSRYYEPHYKVKFNYDLILSNNYICHFLVLQTEVLKKLQFRKLYDGAQDYDLVLRCIRLAEKKKSQGSAAQILHVDKILYHWRCHLGSTADNPASKMYAYEAGRKAVSDYCSEQGMKVFLHHEKHLGFYRMEYQRDIFRVRPDIGAVGGRMIKNRKIYAGAYDEEGRILYEGLHKNFSGYMHRAVLRQDVDAVDIRCIRLRKELLPLLHDLLTEELGEAHTLCKAVSGQENGEDAISETVMAAWRIGSVTQEQLSRISIELGRCIRQAGYLVLWDPGMELVLKEI